MTTEESGTDSRLWPLAAGSGVGRSHGTSRTEPFDRWFRYPAGFASDYVRMLLDQIGITAGMVIDPFAGSGVTGTAARHRGLDFGGIEAHPLIAELAALKLQENADPASIADKGRRAVTTVGRSIAARRDRDVTFEAELVTRSFDPTSLLALLELRDFIKSSAWDETLPYLKWALLGTLRDVAAVKVGWPYQRPGVERTPRYADVLSRFEQRLAFMVHDVATEVENAKSTKSCLVRGDSRAKESWLALPAKGQGCVSSPPYLNNFDYADATRLELYFWGDITTWREMCTQVRADMLTATTQQSSLVSKREAAQQLEDDGDGPSEKVLALAGRLKAARVSRAGRSKEYDQVVPAYFVAMREILTNLFQHLEPGSPVLWLIGDSAPYGVYINTPALIGEFAELCGFDVKEDVSLRARGQRWAANPSRTRASLSERALVLHRP